MTEAQSHVLVIAVSTGFQIKTFGSLLAAQIVKQQGGKTSDMGVTVCH